MATQPQSRLRSDDAGNYVVQDKDSSGHTVDILLEQGKTEEARAEIERLCLEGLDSGDPVRMTTEKWEEFCVELHRKAKLVS
jgi:hypothetical protein